MPDFSRPGTPAPTQHLFLGNCGPKQGITQQQLQQLLGAFDASCQLHDSPEDASHVYASFCSTEAAAAAKAALNGQTCAALGGRLLAVRYAELRPPKASPEPLPVHTSAHATGIPGLQLLHNFITPEQEQALLAAVDAAPWQALAKRRVQHYGFDFKFDRRGVDAGQKPQELPAWVQPVLEQVQGLPDMPHIDQITVNEYTPGVGLSPHIDTHSAFTGAILSLSLAGPCVMELRRQLLAGQQQEEVGQEDEQQQQQNGTGQQQQQQDSDQQQEVGQQQQQQGIQASPSPSGSQPSIGLPAAAVAAAAAAAGAQAQVPSAPAYERRLLLLPPRSLLILGGESRYAWEHYIPHRKADWVNGVLVKRADRRVSLTFRETRCRPCDCAWLAFCDSQQGQLPPTRLAQMAVEPGAAAAAAAAATRDSTAAAAAGTAAGAIAFNGQRDSAVTAPRATCPQQSAPVAAAPTAAAALAAASEAGRSIHSQQQDIGHGQQAEEEGHSEAAAAALEAAYVHQVYDAIAPHFSATRFAIWPKVRAFIDALPAAAVVADVGCGNGKYFAVRKDLAVLGSDRSAGLAGVAAQRLRPGTATLSASLSPAADVFVADALALPHRPSSCDGVLCIAVLHHISTVARRVALLRQLAAVLRPGGRALVTVWATQQEQPEKTIHKWSLLQDSSSGSSRPEAAVGVGDGTANGSMPSGVSCAGGGQGPIMGTSGQGPDYLVPWHVPFHRAGALAQQVQQQVQQRKQQQEQQQGGHADGALNAQPRAACGTTAAGVAATAAAAAPRVDSTKQAVVYQRYYHLFEEGELPRLVGQVEGVVLRDTFYDASNWCVVFERVA